MPVRAQTGVTAAPSSGVGAASASDAANTAASIVS
jgi:hypothetical protein